MSGRTSRPPQLRPAEILGYWASPLTQLIEVRATHAQLRAELHLTEHPEILLRIGRAPDVAPTKRRLVADVIIEAG